MSDGTASVVCLIPARAGSTRVPDKNMAVVGGEALLVRAVRVAREAFVSVVVSTDSHRYADAARAAGAEVPGLRPADLAADDTPMREVVEHALGAWVGTDAEIVVLVQPTSPFTESGDLLGVVDALRRRSDAYCSFTAVRLPAPTGFLLAESGDGLARAVSPELSERRSQDMPALWMPSGNAFASRTGAIRSGGPFLADPVAVVEVPVGRALDIDSPDDLAEARSLAAGTDP